MKVRHVCFLEHSSMNVVAIYQSAKITRLEFSAITYETAVLFLPPTFRVCMHFTKKHGMVSCATTLEVFLRKTSFCFS